MIFLGWWVFLSCWLPFWLILLRILLVCFWTTFDVFFLCLAHDAFYPSKKLKIKEPSIESQNPTTSIRRTPHIATQASLGMAISREGNEYLKGSLSHHLPNQNPTISLPKEKTTLLPNKSYSSIMTSQRLNP